MAKSKRPLSQCPNCMKVLKIKHKGLYGRKTICPKCEVVFTLEPLMEFDAQASSSNQTKIKKTTKPKPVEKDDWDDFGDLDDFGSDDEDEDLFEDDFGSSSAPSAAVAAPPGRRAREKSQRAASQEPKKRPRKKKRPKNEEVSSFHLFLWWCLGGGAGGLIGALLWGVIIYFTNREIGYVAWAVGGCVGVGTAAIASAKGDSQGTGAGLTASFIAILSILLGKAFGVFLLIQNAGLFDGAGQSSGIASIFAAIIAVPFMLSAWDLLFGFLAVGTAYKLGAGITD